MTTTHTDNVKAFWQSRAQETSDDGEVTHADIWQRWLEIEIIKQHLRPSDRVIDVGCGNGYTTRLIAPLVDEIIGIDSCSEMIARANQACHDQEHASAKLTFSVGDVLKLSEDRFGTFDLAISERCLINLDGWEAQKRAIDNMASVLRPSGRCILIEGSANGRARLNDLRRSVGVTEMPTIWHNRDFNEADLLQYVNRHFTVEVDRRLGVYDLISRVVHPLHTAPELPDYRAKINEVAARLALVLDDCVDISRAIVLVMRKRGHHDS